MYILRIDVARNAFAYEPVPNSWERLGGRGLIARIMLDEGMPRCDPLGSRNKLIFASGLLSGHVVPSCNRISIGGKSPLTGGIKESNAGGTTGWHLARMGAKALIIEGVPQISGLSILHVTRDGVRFDTADDVSGMGAYDTARRLRQRYGSKVAMALIGPAGESRLYAACINNLDVDGTPSRLAGRGGMGAVMGSKGLKAIVFDAGDGKMDPPVDPQLFQQARKDFAAAVLANPVVHNWHDYGTSINVATTNMLGCFPTRGFSSGRFEKAENISAEKLRDVILERGAPGRPNHVCMAGCVVQCSNILVDEEGQEIVAPLEYETIGLLGGNLEIDNLDVIGRLNWTANDLGVDSIDLGAALGVAAEAGLLEFGNGEQALDLIRGLYQNTAIGRILGSGACIAAKVLGVRRIPAAKGQAFAAYDPRALKGTGITYATSPQGADHTAGFTMRAKVDHLDPEANLSASHTAQINTAAIDSLGACLLVGAGFSGSRVNLKNLLHALYGWEVPETIQQDMGKEVLLMEREFNKRAGFTDADDRLPEWVSEELLPPTNSVFDVSDYALDAFFEGL